MKRAISVFLLSFSILTLSAGSSYAVAQPEAVGSENEPRLYQVDQSLVDARQQKIDDLMKKRQAVCDNTKARVATATKTLEQSKNRYQKRYQTMTQNLERLSTKLSEVGLDTTVLDEKIAEFVFMQNEFQNQYQNSVTSMNALSTPACDGDVELFQEQRSLANAHMEQFKAQVKAMNTFLKDEIKTELQKLQLLYTQLKSSESEVTEEN